MFSAALRISAAGEFSAQKKTPRCGVLVFSHTTQVCPGAQSKFWQTSVSGHKARPESAGPARQFAPRTLATGVKSSLPQSVRTPTAWVSNIECVAETLAVRFLLQASVLQQLGEMITRYRGQDHKESEDYFCFVAKLRQLQ
jgi:hypothetical protein